MPGSAVLATASAPGGSTRTETLIRVAHAILEHAGYEGIGPRKVHRLVRQYQDRVAPNGWSFLDYLANAVQMDAERRRGLFADPALARVIAYADPTGETAVKNVMREAS